MGAGQDPDADDESPGLRELFRHYDDIYFRGALAGAGFSVERAAPRSKTITSFGYCSLGDLSKITLYKPMPRHRTNADLKNALLHLMIHGIVFLKRGLTSLGHGPAFRDWMDAINTSSIEDYARPVGGYCITTTHDFSQEKSCNMQGFLWKCESCGDTLMRAKNLGPPSDFCCIENVSQPATCRNMLCHWHNHKDGCRGKYVVTKPAVTPGQKMAPKGTTKMSKSQQGAVQQSYPDSDEVQESGSLKKARKRNVREDFQKAIVLSAAPRRKPKQELIAWAKREHLLSSNAKSPGSSPSKKADDSQKAIVLSAAPRSRRLKRKQASVASEEHGFVSPGSYNNANSPRSNTSRKEVQKSGVQPCASQKKPKLGQGLVALEKHISRPAATQSTTVKQPAKSSSSMKTRRQHRPEDSRMITVQPAAPLTRSKRKQSNRAAPARQAARSEARGSAEEKEYVCFSLWLNFYESECSSGSAEPLVNKRTVRRRRERERLVQIARSRSIEARPDEEVSSGQTEPPPLHLEVIAIDDEVMAEAPSMDVLAPPADQVVTRAHGAGGQSQPPAPSMDVVVPPADHGGRSDRSTSMDIAGAVAPADKVMVQAPVDQSQPPAPCSIAAGQVGAPRSADPPGVTPPNPRSWPAVIDISDDDDD